MSLFQVAAASIAADIASLAQNNPRKQPWIANVIPGHEKITVHTRGPDAGNPHECWVDFVVHDSATSAMVKARVCNTSHISNRIKDHVIRELEMRHR